MQPHSSIALEIQSTLSQQVPNWHHWI